MPEPASIDVVRSYAMRRHRFDRWGAHPYHVHLQLVESRSYARMYHDESRTFVNAIHGDYLTTRLYGRLLAAYALVERLAA